VNDSFGLFKNHTNRTDEVLWVNAHLKDWCAKENVGFIDLYGRFKMSDGEKMNSRYTNDGLHLLGDGYLLWAEIIKPILSSKK
jgi:lysophospholipase L1-like esterase